MAAWDEDPVVQPATTVVSPPTLPPQTVAPVAANAWETDPVVAPAPSGAATAPASSPASPQAYSYVKPPDVGTGEAFLRGAGDGLTFGFSDELVGGAKAALQPVFGTGDSSDSFGDRFDKNVDEQRGLLKAAQDQHPVATIAGGLVGGIAPAVLTGGTTAGASLAANVGRGALYGAGYGAAYGFGSAEGDPLERLPEAAKGAAIGGVLGAALPAVIGGAGALTRSAAKKTEAELVAQQAATQTARNDQAAANAANGSADVLSDREGVVQAFADAAQSGRRTQAQTLASLADEVAPDQKILDAADHLGMRGDLIPSQYSKSQAYRETEQAIASIPGSEINAKQVASYQTLSQKADDLITQYGGSLDKSAFSDKFRVESQATINGLNKQAEDLYSRVTSAIPAQTQAPADNTIALIQGRIADFGGASLLSADERKALNVLMPSSEVIPNPMIPGTVQTVTKFPTYAALDAVRKSVGDGYKGRGPFANSSSRTLDALYSSLSKDQQAIADAAGVGNIFTAAKSVVAQRKGLEDNLVQAIGKDMTGAITSSFGTAVKSLEKGDFKNFDKLIGLIPPHLRQEAVITSLNDAFTNRSGAQKQLNVPGFVDWYTGISRNEAAKERFTKYLDPGAVKTLDAIAVLGGGMRRASKEYITTGKANSVNMLRDITEDGGLLSKVMDIGKQVGAAEGVTSSLGFPGAGTVGVMTKILSAKKTPITEAAEALIQNPKFHDAIFTAANTNGAQIGRMQAREAQLMRTLAYRKWFAALGEDAKAQIRSVGPVTYLMTDQTPQTAKPKPVELPPTTVTP
jgi:hypothetical protein